MEYSPTLLLDVILYGTLLSDVHTGKLVISNILGDIYSIKSNKNNQIPL